MQSTHNFLRILIAIDTEKQNYNENRYHLFLIPNYILFHCTIMTFYIQDIHTVQYILYRKQCNILAMSKTMSRTMKSKVKTQKQEKRKAKGKGKCPVRHLTRSFDKDMQELVG